MQYQYEEITNIIKKGSIRKESLEETYRSLTKLQNAAEEELRILRNLSNVLDNEREMSDAIYWAITRKHREVEALEELVTIVRRRLF